MVSVEWVPFCRADSYVLDIRRVVPVPGLTGSPSLRIVLAIADRFGDFERPGSHTVTSRVEGRDARQVSPQVMTAQAIRASNRVGRVSV